MPRRRKTGAEMEECKSLKQMKVNEFIVISEVVTKKLNHIAIIKGDFHAMPVSVQRFVAEKAHLMTPRGIWICDGSQQEADEITVKMVEHGMISPLSAYDRNYICRTDPKDVARVESKTWMITQDKHQSVCRIPKGVKPIMCQWMSPDEAYQELDNRFPGCMAGRIMYVLPFSMGPIGGPLSRIGVQLTDSKYVVLSMRIMTRLSLSVFDQLNRRPLHNNSRDKDGGNDDQIPFVRAIHSVGLPRPVKQKVINYWPCNPDRVFIGHRPNEREIWSFGSGYGGNSLLGKKCFALRIASNIARDEGWMAEHMLIMGITNPEGKERFVAAAFPSACGKTNLAMLQPTIPGWKVQVIGDDIAWMKFDKDGQLYAINPESGFFGVAPGTSNKTQTRLALSKTDNPMAMSTCNKNTIFTNIAETSNGEYFWEGLEKELKDSTVEIITWLGEKWHVGDEGNAAHPNSRFCCPVSQCPIVHPLWESPQGVPIYAIIFGGRRPEGVPLVYEAFNWAHGVFLGACLKSESTAAAEHVGKTIMHDPMAMRPFMGYNFGKYLEHWLSLEAPGRKMPKIFHVNWFRQNEANKFLWPGFCDNIRVLGWILRRVDNDDSICEHAPIGIIPKRGSINLDNLGPIDWTELMSIPKDYWKADVEDIRHFFETQIGSDLPEEIRAQFEIHQKRIDEM